MDYVLKVLISLVYVDESKRCTGLCKLRNSFNLAAISSHFLLCQNYEEHYDKCFSCNRERSFEHVYYSKHLYGVKQQKLNNL